MKEKKEEFLEKLINDFFSKNLIVDSAQIFQMLEMIDANISFVIKTHEKNKEFLEELVEFPNKNIDGYNKFCDKFLRKKIGDVIGIDSIFLYTHPTSYKEELSREFEIEMEDEVLKLIKNYAEFLLKENISEALTKNSWLAKISKRS